MLLAFSKAPMLRLPRMRDPLDFHRTGLDIGRSSRPAGPLVVLQSARPLPLPFVDDPSTSVAVARICTSATAGPNAATVGVLIHAVAHGRLARATLSSARLLVCSSAVHSPSCYSSLVFTVKTDLRTSGIGVRGRTQPKHMLAVQSWPGSVYRKCSSVRPHLSCERGLGQL
jgi:hypothetical protein